MLQAIKSLLGIKKLERNQRVLKKNLSSLLVLAKKLSRGEEGLVRGFKKIRTSQQKISDDLGCIENRLQAIREELKSKIEEEEIDQIEGEISHIKDLLQQVKQDNLTEGIVEKVKNKKRNNFTIQDMIHQLPSSLKEVVKTLFEGEKPLSYSRLASRMGKKEATARSYVYRLKEKGFPLEFSNSTGERKKVKLPLRVKRQLTVPKSTGDQKG